MRVILVSDGKMDGTGGCAMASSRDHLAYVLDLLGDAECISHRAMVGEYMLYTCGKVFGGIYDDRFLVKPTESAIRLLPHVEYQLPYDEAKPMLLVDTEDRRLIPELVAAMEPELPQPKRRK